MDRYKNIKTEENYLSLLKSGMFWEFHPELTGDWNEDFKVINPIEKKKYSVILSDPAWKQSKGGKKKVRPKSSGEELEYPTITLDDIKEIQKKARNLGNENHVCFLWTIDKYLHESEQMMYDLGYKLHARMIWNKVTGIPAAFTVRYGHEYLLYFYFGKLIPVAKDERGKIHTVFTEQVKQHSRKPEISYQIIERLYPNFDKLELFARREREGWDVWGNEVESSVAL
jgi:N6-adenosine-specific RNA methylase IME4